MACVLADALASEALSPLDSAAAAADRSVEDGPPPLGLPTGVLTPLPEVPVSSPSPGGGGCSPVRDSAPRDVATTGSRGSTVRVLARLRPALPGAEEDEGACLRVISGTKLEVLTEPRALLFEPGPSRSRRRRTTGGIQSPGGSRSEKALSDAARAAAAAAAAAAGGGTGGTGGCGAGASGAAEGSASAGGGVWPSAGLDSRIYTFDLTFDAAATDDEVFSAMREELSAAISGEAVCILAFGATGSGKTHTVKNIAERAAKELGCKSREFQNRGMRLEITVQLLEIYNDQVRDLLAEGLGTGEPPTLRMSMSTSSNSLQGAVSRDITSDSCDGVAKSLQEILKAGQAQRATSATAVHGRSSRSHLVMTLSLGTREEATGALVRSVGKFSLVDLAGSERLKRSEAVGERLREATHINKSLSALADVVTARERKVGHVPYRNSKLTYLLQDSLGGQQGCRTVFIIAVPPSRAAVCETLNSLQFSQRLSALAEPMKVSAAAQTHMSCGPGSPRSAAASPVPQERGAGFSLPGADRPAGGHAAAKREAALAAEVERLRAELAQVRAQLQEAGRQLQERELVEAQLHAELAEARAAALHAALEAQAAADSAGAPPRAALVWAPPAPEAAAADRPADVPEPAPAPLGERGAREVQLAEPRVEDAEEEAAVATAAATAAARDAAAAAGEGPDAAAGPGAARPGAARGGPPAAGAPAADAPAAGAPPRAEENAAEEFGVGAAFPGAEGVPDSRDAGGGEGAAAGGVEGAACAPPAGELAAREPGTPEPPPAPEAAGVESPVVLLGSRTVVWSPHKGKSPPSLGDECCEASADSDAGGEARPPATALRANESAPTRYWIGDAPAQGATLVDHAAEGTPGSAPAAAVAEVPAGPQERPAAAAAADAAPRGPAAPRCRPPTRRARRPWTRLRPRPGTRPLRRRMAPPPRSAPPPPPRASWRA